MGLMDTIGHAMLDNDRLHFSGQDGLTATETWLLALGAPLAVFSGNYVDALQGRDDDERIRAGMEQMWGITDRGSFESTASWLVEEGQREKYFALWQGMQTMEGVRRRANPLLKLFAAALVEVQAHRAADAASLAAATGLKRREVTERLTASQSWVGGIDKALGLETSALHSFVAWDAVRLVNVTRWALQLGWIARPEFAMFADGLSGAVQGAYSNWQEVAAAYVVAGLVWDYSEAREEGLLRACKLLADNPMSPYRTSAFRPAF